MTEEGVICSAKKVSAQATWTEMGNRELISKENQRVYGEEEGKDTED